MFLDKLKPMVALLAAGVCALALVYGLKLIDRPGPGDGGRIGVLAVKSPSSL